MMNNFEMRKAHFKTNILYSCFIIHFFLSLRQILKSLIISLMTQPPHDLNKLRHSLAHLLAAAVLDLWPGTKRAIGPAIENGFYYDFEFETPISDSDLSKIEKKMREILPSGENFDRAGVGAPRARELFKDEPYKLDLIDEFENSGEKITTYSSCPTSTSYKLQATSCFVDLCAGGHVENVRDINPSAFKLTSIAGAYWRGSEENPILTRIYGVAFGTKDDLEKHLKMLAEAEKRDHRKLGKELDLFVFSDLVGSGLPLWTPRGTLMRNLLDDFVWELRKTRGYEQVDIPHLTKKELYETSGHWDKFKDDLFRITTREGHEFAMKPMNCPHHTQIFARRPHSYREMPQRFCETTMMYRDEQSGELNGLSRVRAITIDDAHVFCREVQIRAEFSKIWEIISEFYGTFGFALQVRLSFHDPKSPEKYLGDKKRWEFAESTLKSIAEEKGVEKTLPGVGEAAFYGPKLDFMANDSLGRQWQVATIQLDMNMPERFDLTCINENGEKERVAMVHYAVMGSIERFLSVILEHLQGALPLWLSPVQAKILPVSEKHAAYAQEIIEQFRAADIRVGLSADDSLGKRIRGAKLEKVPYVLVVGDAEVDAKTATLEGRAGKIGALPIADIIHRLKEEIRTRAG